MPYGVLPILYYVEFILVGILKLIFSPCFHYFFIWTNVLKKKWGGAAKNRYAKKIKLLKIAEKSQKISSMFKKQTKLEPVSKQ